MKKFLLIVALLLTTTMFSQRYVEVEGYQKHKIAVSDSLTEAVVKEFYWNTYKNRVDYETKLTKLKAVKVKDTAREVLHYYHKGTIYINSYADKFPNSKRVLILHELGKFYGVPTTKGGSLDVMNENFYLTEKYEKNYKNRRLYFTDMKDLMKKLERYSRLKTK